MSAEARVSETVIETSDQTKFQNVSCFFCGIVASNEVFLKQCEHCRLVWFCGTRHEKLHRPKNKCYPLRVERHPTKGILISKFSQF